MRLCACGCGVDISGRHSNAKWATPGCHKRVQRGHVAEVVPIAGAESDGLVRAATRRALADVEQAGSPRGVAALMLAARLDERRDTGAGLASLNREWRVTLDEALQVARPVSSVGRMRDELAERRSKGA